MPAITTRSEHTDHWTKMHQSRGSRHTRSRGATRIRSGHRRTRQQTLLSLLRLRGTNPHCDRCHSEPQNWSATSCRKLSAVAFIIITIMITAPLPAIAYTQADADACTPDAMRLCASAIPDVSRVAFCLAHNKQQLNSACAAVFNRPRGASSTRVRRENIQKTNF
jgi:hypothetical protein